MQCHRCGNFIAQDARFCSHCGSPIFTPQPYAVPVLDTNRVSRHIQSLGSLWLLYAGIRLLAGLGGLFFIHSTFLHHMNQNWGPFSNAWEGILWPFAATSLVFTLLLTLFTGFSLVTRQPWGRVLAIIYGIFALIHFPLGTALGIYTLWVLAPRISGEEYARLSTAATQA